MRNNTNESIQDSYYYDSIPSHDNSIAHNQLFKANEVRDEAYKKTIGLFSEQEPYDIFKSIFNTNVYAWNELFVAKLISIMENGVYPNNLKRKEKELIEMYIDYKYNSTIPSELLISLDDYIGAM